jgi:hypothetical protein
MASGIPLYDPQNDMFMWLVSEAEGVEGRRRLGTAGTLSQCCRYSYNGFGAVIVPRPPLMLFMS